MPILFGYLTCPDCSDLVYIFLLPAFFDFPFSYLLAKLLELLGVDVGQYLFYIVLFFVGSLYWYSVGLVIGIGLQFMRLHRQRRQ
ncbi:MAG: hypothetical protein KKG33_02165 [candidate division Zixibacteria bacterium]|nr:hypothetical protein [candidate division Zixibacteria bacterium]